MPITFEQAQQHGDDLEGRFADRNSMFEKMEDMYLLKAPSLPTENWIKQTVSPSARNALLGAVRLMTAVDPIWSVPTGMSPEEQDKASKVEQIARAIWVGAGRAARKPIHADIVLSALMYGEVQMAVNLTADLVAAATEDNKDRMGHVAAQTPVLFDVINPRLGYPEFDRAGLSAYYSAQEIRVSDVIARYGQDAAAQLSDRQAWETVTHCEYWDAKMHYIWLKELQNPLVELEHGLPCIPVVCQVIEGGSLFGREGQLDRQPFLYGLWKSGLWERETLALTVMYSLIFAVGANPQWVYRRNDTNKQAPVVDYSVPGGQLVLDAGEGYEPLAKQVLDPSLLQGLTTAQSLGVESTIYQQALGASPTHSGASFSEIALLSQAGRLPLVSAQRMGSFAIGEAMRVAFKLLKTAGGKASAWGEKGDVSFKAADLPDRPNIEARLEVSLPQDDRQNALIALQMTQGDSPLMSKARAREEYLGIGQPDQEEKAIWTEKAQQAQLQMMVQQEIEKAQMQAQQQMMGGQQPGQPGGMPPQQMAQPGMPPQGMPPDMGQLQQTGAGQGMPGMGMGAPMDPSMMGGQPGGEGL